MNKLFLLLLLCATTLNAQPGHDGPPRHADRPEQNAERFARIKAARQAFITEELKLTSAQAEAFFPVYWAYDKRMKDGRKTGPHRGRPGESARKLTEAEARTELLQRRTHRQQMITLSLEAEDEFLKLLPATKVIRLPEIEREFRKKLWDRTRGHRRN